MSSIVCRVLYIALFLSPMLMFQARPAAGQATQLPIASTFDTDTEGWQTIFINQQRNPPVVEFVADGGNPGGYIRAADQLDGPQWYWTAPAKFLGDRSSAYGLILSFDHATTDISRPITAPPSVILYGDGLSVSYPTSVLPGTQWSRVNIRLDETAGWAVRNADGTPGAPASAEDMRKVLGSLTGLRIRGEYNFGPDANALDNVILGEQPSRTVFLPIIRKE